MRRGPLEPSAAASARPISPPPRMMTSDRVMEAAVSPETWPWREPSRLTRESSRAHCVPNTYRGKTMATAAERARKRDLGPDWREKLRDSVRLLAIRTIGTLLVAASLARGVALATHEAATPSFSTAPGGPPVNWVGSPGAYSSDLLLMMFGPAPGPLLPLIAGARLRMVRGDSAGPL